MKKSQFLKVSAAPFALSLALISAPAFAQDAEVAAQAEETADAGGDIVVTGSLIRNPNLQSSSPVNVTTADEVELLQSNLAEEILREIPGAVPSIGSAVNNGNGGASFVNLRNLGSNRNLVLLDGQRIVTAGLGGQVDLNNIPLALVERMDVLTGGASTTYGADAVSGVVNFVTKRDFAGVEATAGYQVTDRGDGNVFRADLTIGANFDDGRGNAVLSLGYQEADAVYQGARGFGRNQINSFSGISAGGSPTSVPTTVVLADGSELQANATGTALVTPYQDFNFNPYNIFQTPFKRYNIYGSARYEVTDNIEVYGRALFSKNTVSTIIAPSGIFGEALNITANNPYLTDTLRNQLCAGAGIANCTGNTVIPLTEVYRRSVEIGPRVSDYTTTVFDYMGGVRVGLTDGIKLDVSANYGESENNQLQSGYVLKSRVQQALLAGNTATCNNTANGCVPLNLFGPEGSITPAMAAFLNGKSTILTKTDLTQVRGVIAGDAGFSSPWASNPISFAVGAEYRDYGLSRIPDNLSAVPGELGGAGGAVPPVEGGYDVYEFFGEVIVPLVEDKAFFNKLSLEAGIRNSHYTVDAVGSPKFSATTWKVGANWEPVDSLMLRGNYQRAVRAPNIGELFTPVSTGLDNYAIDPCAGSSVQTLANGDANKAYNAGLAVGQNLRNICLGQGAPAAVIDGVAGILQPAAGQVNVTGGGNPNLKPEKANTYTFGLVFRPDFVPGLSATVDYYNITVNDAITAAVPGDIMGACFNNITATSATSIECTGIRRAPGTGRLSGSSATTPGLPQPLTNLGRLKTDGIDFTVNYRTDLGFAGLDIGVAGNWTNSSRFRASSSSLDRECIGQYSVNCASIQPEWSWNQRTTLKFDGVDVSLLWRHISGVKYEEILARRPFDGTVTGTGPEVGNSYNFGKIKAYDWFDLTTRFDVTDNFGLTLTVQNIFDKRPPVVGATVGSTSFNSGNTYPSTYDVLGRRFGIQGKLKF